MMHPKVGPWLLQAIMRETTHTITQAALSNLMIIGGATPLGLAQSRPTAPDLRSCRYSDRVFLSKWSRAAFHDNAMGPAIGMLVHLTWESPTPVTVARGRR